MSTSLKSARSARQQASHGGQRLASGNDDNQNTGSDLVTGKKAVGHTDTTLAICVQD